MFEQRIVFEGSFEGAGSWESRTRAKGGLGIGTGNREHAQGYVERMK